MRSRLERLDRKIYKGYKKITFLSFLFYPLFVAIFIIISSIFGYGVAEDNFHFHFPSLVLNMIFALTILFNLLCTGLSLILFLGFLVRRKGKNVKEYGKEAFFGIYPIFLIAAFWSFDIWKIIDYFKTPFRVILLQWNWILNCLRFRD